MCRLPRAQLRFRSVELRARVFSRDGEGDWAVVEGREVGEVEALAGKYGAVEVCDGGADRLGRVGFVIDTAGVMRRVDVDAEVGALRGGGRAAVVRTDRGCGAVSADGGQLGRTYFIDQLGGMVTDLPMKSTSDPNAAGRGDDPRNASSSTRWCTSMFQSAAGRLCTLHSPAAATTCNTASGAGVGPYVSRWSSAAAAAAQQ